MLSHQFFMVFTSLYSYGTSLSKIFGAQNEEGVASVSNYILNSKIKLVSERIVGEGIVPIIGADIGCATLVALLSFSKR